MRMPIFSLSPGDTVQIGRWTDKGPAKLGKSYPSRFRFGKVFGFVEVEDEITQERFPAVVIEMPFPENLTDLGFSEEPIDEKAFLGKEFADRPQFLGDVIFAGRKLGNDGAERDLVMIRLSGGRFGGLETLN